MGSFENQVMPCLGVGVLM